MKKATLTSMFSITIMLLISITVNAQKFKGLDKSPMDAAAFPIHYKNADKLIKIIYSRPQLKGRPLSKLAPNGKIWRTGANESPELTLFTDMKFGSKTIKAGTYTFYVIPNEKEWTAIISTDVNTWGTYFYKKENDVARLKIPVTKGKSLENFSIAFKESDNGIDMHLGWDTVRVAVPFTK